MWLLRARRRGPEEEAQAVIIATGSEVQLALAAQKYAGREKDAVRVVSMPSTTTFDRESADYKKSIAARGLPRIAVEMGVTDFWWKYGCAAVVASTPLAIAPAPVLFKHFGSRRERRRHRARRSSSRKSEVIARQICCRLFL